MSGEANCAMFRETKGRKICRETDLAGGLTVALPENAGAFVADRLRHACEKGGVTVVFLENPPPGVLYEGRVVLVIGNLADSLCAEYLYYKMLSITDLRYPGAGGYELRTLLDPFGTGKNILRLGYSDCEGLELGLAAFGELIAPVTPFLFTVKASSLLCADQYAREIRDCAVPESEVAASIHSSLWWYAGHLAYQTGDLSYLRPWLRGWRTLIEVSGRNPAVAVNMHLYSFSHVSVWYILEHTGLIPDDIRGEIENVVFRWAHSGEGAGYADMPHNQKTYIPSHNHAMFCALSLELAADFLRHHYGDPDAQKLRDIARNVFYSFDHGGWKPVCDDSSYAPSVTLPLVVLHSYYDDDHAFLKQGAAQAAGWLKMILGQNGFVPSYGDGGYGSYPHFLARALAHFLRDGELLALSENALAEDMRNPSMFGHATMFTAGLAPHTPLADGRVNIIPMDPLQYGLWDRDEEEARVTFCTPPACPIEKTFDKLSIRTSYEEDGTFLLVDGLGSAGIHAYPDASGILDFTARGVVWLVEEMCYQSEPEKCNILTIARDGIAAPIPSFTQLLDVRQTDGVSVIRLLLQNYNGTQWLRELTLEETRLTVRDTVRADADGDFVISAHFRTPGVLSGEGGRFISLRRDKAGRGHGMTIAVSSASGFESLAVIKPERQNVKPLRGTPSLEKKRELWHRRYNNDDYVITTLTTRASASLRAGEEVTLTHTIEIDGVEAAMDTVNKVYEIEREAVSYEIEGVTLRGEGDAGICAYDQSGTLLWARKWAEKKTIFPSWQYEKPYAAGIGGARVGDTVYVAAGCGDNYVRVFTLDGAFVSEFYIYATIPERILFVDVDRDGVPEILSSGKLSNRGTHYVNRLDGTTVENINVGPWLCTFRSVCVTEEDGVLRLAQGMNYGVNFKEVLITTSGERKKGVEKSMGATVNGIVRLRGGYAASSSNGTVIAFSDAGENWWYADIGQSISGMSGEDGILTVSLAGGGEKRLSLDGKLL